MTQPTLGMLRPNRTRRNGAPWRARSPRPRCGRDLGVAVELRQLLRREAVEIGHRAEQALAPRVAARTARRHLRCPLRPDPVDERLQASRGTCPVGAAVHDLALGLDDLGVAQRAARGHAETLRALRVRADGPTTCGITSPARCTITVSPSRMSLRLMSSSLCSVACRDRDSADATGSSCAHGLSAPVRPTRMRSCSAWSGRSAAPT